MPYIKSSAEEIAKWKDTISQRKEIQVIAETSEFLIFQYERSPYIHAKVTFTFKQDDEGTCSYPNVPLIVTIDRLHPPGLVKKLLREMEAVAKSNVDCHDYHQIQPVAKYLIDFLDTNLFVPCWKEVKQIVELSKEPSACMTIVSMNESKGTIRLKFVNGKYNYECKLVVNPGYPTTINLDDPIQLQTIKTNFPKPTVEDVLVKLQFKGFIRNMQDGIPENEAWLKSNPILLAQQKEQTFKDDPGEPIRSLLPVVSFLRLKVQALPQTLCPMCHSTIFPKEPQQQQAQSKNKKNKLHPTYSSCGCWYHYACMDRFLSEPPSFGTSACLTCKGSLVYHPDWPSKPKERQKSYSQQQARQREIDDVAMMF